MDFIFKKFIKHYSDVNNQDVRISYGKFTGIVGIISNTLLCIIKIIAGIVTCSVAIVADGINNLTDVASSIITLFGFKLSAMPEDKEHPYGHERIEYISGLITSVIIIVVGIELAKTSVSKIINPAETHFSWLIIILLFIAILLKLLQSKFYFAAGNKINSTALRASAIDSRNDTVSTALVLLSLILSKYSGYNLDGYFGALVSVLVIFSGINLVKITGSQLLGEAPSEVLINSITDLVTSFPGVLGTHDLMVHTYGPAKTFVSIHIEVDAKSDILEAHDLMDQIEHAANKKLKITLTAHMDPIMIDDPVRQIVLQKITNAYSDIKGVANIHDLRVVPGITHISVIFDLALTCECTLSHEALHSIAVDATKDYEITVVVSINFEKSYI